MVPTKRSAMALARGARTGEMATVYVAIADHPGELARLFGDAGEVGVNIEDLRMDHDPAREYGLVEITVTAGSADHLLAALTDRDWTAHR
jgi:prephenate dehydrogenase